MKNFKKALHGSTTTAEVKERNRKAKQDELGVCRIRSEGDTLGSGFVVRDLQIFIPGFLRICFPYCLISSDKVFPKDNFNTELSYYLDFRKLHSTKLRTIKLENIAAKSPDIFRTSGLVGIRIDPSEECGEKQSIFVYRPFKVANEGIKSADDDLRCYYVNHSCTEFVVKWLKMQQSDVPGQYELHEATNKQQNKTHETPTYAEVTHKGDRKPYVAVILKRSENEFMAAGALTFTDDECKNISPVFFPLPPPPPLGASAGQPAPDDNNYPPPEQHLSADEAASVEVEASGETTNTAGESVDAGSGKWTRSPSTSSFTEGLKRRLSTKKDEPLEHNKEEDTDIAQGPITIIEDLSPQQETKEGSKVELVFKCKARNNSKLFYQWFKDDTELHGKNESILALKSVALSEFGCYKCHVSCKDSPSDVVKSSPADLDVTPCDGTRYKELNEIDPDTQDRIETLLTQKRYGLGGWKQIAFKYGMDKLKIKALQDDPEAGRKTVEFLNSQNPYLTVYHFCKTLKEYNIRRLDIVKELLAHLSVSSSSVLV